MRKKQTKKQPQNTLVEDELATYQIRVKGLVDEQWSDYFSGFSITHQDDDISVLVGVVRDQAALFGVLIRIRDLGISLLKVEQLEDLSDLS
jgi:hypothetical protein